MAANYVETPVAENYRFVCDADLAAHLRDSLFLLYSQLPEIGALPQYSSYCILMSSLIALVLNNQKFRVKLVACRVLINIGDDRYFLGSGAPLTPKQFDGHFACVVNNRFLVDFGLGSARRHLNLECVPQAVAVRTKRFDSVRDKFAKASLPNGPTLEWVLDNQSRNQKELLKGDHVEARRLFRIWRNRFVKQAAS